MRAVVIIPARYGSTRLPGKLIHPEAKRVTGKYIIEHVYEKVVEAQRIAAGDEEPAGASTVMSLPIIATDDERISDVVKGFCDNVEMTSTAHQSGTDRIAEVAAHRDEDIIVNVQGDEPEIHPEMIKDLISALSKDKEAVMATLANEIKTVDELLDPNVVKVVIDNKDYALYFSRAPIPYLAHGSSLMAHRFFRHIGVYAYRRDFLLKYTKLPPSPLEEIERLEQLRALSNGYKIKVSITTFECRGIDTEEDLKRFLDKYGRQAIGDR